LTTFFIVCSFACLNKGISQHHYTVTSNLAGVYYSYNDFKNGNISDGFPLYKKEHTLWPKGFFVFKDAVIKTPDTSINYKLSDIWGYTNHKGQLIRVYENKHYKVVCGEELIIYVIYSPTKVSYHFSKSINEPIYRLSKNNIRREFKDNPELVKSINSIKRKYWLMRYHKNNCFLIDAVFYNIKTNQKNDDNSNEVLISGIKVLVA